MANPERVVLVDGSNLMYRAFFGLPRTLVTSRGEPTHAVFGFATMFKKIFAGRAPTRGAVVFDAPGPTFRDERFPEYKAQRPPVPGDLASQIPLLMELCEAQGFPVLQVPGVEADDVIGTLAREGRDAGHDVVIVSSDKDFAQLVGGPVRMLDTMRDVTYDASLVKKKWGVRPDQIVDYLALLGDAVDNVPGVPGIGEKSAVDLLDRFDTLDGVYAHLAALTPRQRAALTEHEALARLSRELVTLDLHVPLPRPLAELRVTPPDADALNALFVRLEFFSLIGASARDALSTDDSLPRDYRRVDTHDALQALLATLAAHTGPVAVAPVFATDASPLAPLAGLALATAPGRACYVALDGLGPTLGGRGLATLGRWLHDPARPKVAHDAKALFRGLTRAGVTLRGVTLDTRLASFLIDPTRLIPHRLDQLTKEHLHRTLRPAKSLLGAGPAPLPFTAADPAALAEWACHRADAIVSMAPLVEARLRDAGHEAQLRDRDLPLSWVLAQMELDGIRVDRADLDALGAELRERLAALEAEVHALAGHPFNLGSTAQLGRVLFEELALPVVKKTKTGWSTDSDVLEALAPRHALPRQVLAWRKLSKLITTYTDVLADAVDPADGRIHATFQQTTGATGRLITTDPDLQRTPTHSPEGQRIRRAFVAAPGHRILSADWSQIELRLLAHVSGDPALVAAFRDGADVHRRTAATLFGRAPEEVTPEERAVGKTVNFATIYGQGATALAQLLGLPRADAKRYIDHYFAHYAGVRAWLDATTAEALERGYVTTLNGRRRYIPELSSESPMDRQAGLRIAANTPIQGSAADLCKAAMLDIAGRLRGGGLRAKMLLQIHDELVFEVPDEEVDTVQAIVRDAMEHAMELRVPLVVTLGVGASWGEAH